MKRPKMFAVLPTMLTLGNAACGFGCITFAAKLGPEQADGKGLLIAASLIFLAMVFDMFDGSVARWTKQTSNFGAQLDSLCDIISFGLAPAFLMLWFSRESHAHTLWENQPLLERLLWVIAALFVVCAALRLARFNAETDEDDSHGDFSGLPSPAAAGVVASFPLAYELLQGERVDATTKAIAEWVLPVIELTLPFVTLAVACLMVSRIRYAHVFNQLFRGQRSRQHVAQLVFTVAAVYWVREMAIPLIFCFFAFAPPIRVLWREVVARRLHKSSEI